MSKSNAALVSVCICYPGIMQLALQAADFFSEPKRLGVRGGQIAGEGLNLTLKERNLG